jgi:hypothetical protein
MVEMDITTKISIKEKPTLGEGEAVGVIIIALVDRAGK